MARLVSAAGAEARAGDTDNSGRAQPGSASHWSSLALRALAYLLLASLALVGYRRVLAVAGAYAGEPAGGGHALVHARDGEGFGAEPVHD